MATKFKLVYDKITPSLKKIDGGLDDLPKIAFKAFKEATPIDKGYARNHTKLKRDTIDADYKYASDLNSGSSRQAPSGMLPATEQAIRNKLNKIFRK